MDNETGQSDLQKYKVTRSVKLNKYQSMMLIYKIEPEI